MLAHDAGIASGTSTPNQNRQENNDDSDQCGSPVGSQAAKG